MVFLFRIFFITLKWFFQLLLSTGDNVELTYINRPEGRVFDWLFEPMTLLKEQIKAANLESTEEEYLYKLALYCGDARMMTSWQNGGVAPADAVKRAQLQGLSRRYNSALLPLCDLNHSLCRLSQTPCQSRLPCLFWDSSLQDIILCASIVSMLETYFLN